MTRPHRIAGGGLILRDDAILLVRYANADGSTYLVGPGGSLKSDENVPQAIVRETMEETGVSVLPHKVLMVEDLACTRFKMCKIWMLCEATSGEVKQTDAAKAEGIIQARWFKRNELVNELVFPCLVMGNSWDSFKSESWYVQCLPSRVMDI